MKERPILFSAPMVRALLDGSKTQTRRVVKPQPFDRSYSTHDHRMAYVSGRSANGDEIDGLYAYTTSLGGEWRAKCPYGQPGDRLYVRETWADLEELSDGNFQRQAIYRADDIERYGDEDEFVDVTAADMRWRPSIHMPRWASRILLEVVSVRVERLNDCSDADALAEGVDRTNTSISGYAKERYRRLWEQINGAGSWDANPWVWVVEFRRIEEGAPRAQEA